MMHTAVVVALPAYTKQGRMIADHMSLPFLQAQHDTFADGETHITIADHEHLANRLVILVHSSPVPVAQNILDLALLAHEVRNAGARAVIGVVLYLGYGRQDKSEYTKKPGAFAAIAALFNAMHLDHIITLALHNQETTRFFSTSITSIASADLIMPYVQNNISATAQPVVVSPDENATKDALAIARLLQAPVVTLHKKRVGHTVLSSITTPLPALQSAVIIDDIIDSGSTALAAIGLLQQAGYKTIDGYFIHPVLSCLKTNPTIVNSFSHIYTFDSIALPQHLPANITVLASAPVIATVLAPIIQTLSLR